MYVNNFSEIAIIFLLFWSYLVSKRKILVKVLIFQRKNKLHTFIWHILTQTCFIVTEKEKLYNKSSEIQLNKQFVNIIE